MLLLIGFLIARKRKGNINIEMSLGDTLMEFLSFYWEIDMNRFYLDLNNQSVMILKEIENDERLIVCPECNQ